MKPRTEAELIAYYRETYPEEHAFNGNVDALIQKDKLRGHQISDIGAGIHYNAEDRYLYNSRGRDPSAPEIEE